MFVSNSEIQWDLNIAHRWSCRDEITAQSENSFFTIKTKPRPFSSKECFFWCVKMQKMPAKALQKKKAMSFSASQTTHAPIRTRNEFDGLFPHNGALRNVF